jgi:hypothetical protein
LFKRVEDSVFSKTLEEFENVIAEWKEEFHWNDGNPHATAPNPTPDEVQDCAGEGALFGTFLLSWQLVRDIQKEGDSYLCRSLQQDQLGKCTGQAFKDEATQPGRAGPAFSAKCPTISVFAGKMIQYVASVIKCSIDVFTGDHGDVATRTQRMEGSVPVTGDIIQTAAHQLWEEMEDF